MITLNALPLTPSPLPIRGHRCSDLHLVDLGRNRYSGLSGRTEGNEAGL